MPIPSAPLSPHSGISRRGRWCACSGRQHSSVKWRSSSHAPTASSIVFRETLSHRRASLVSPFLVTEQEWQRTHPSEQFGRSVVNGQPALNAKDVSAWGGIYSGAYIVALLLGGWYVLHPCPFVQAPPHGERTCRVSTSYVVVADAPGPLTTLAAVRPCSRFRCL